VADGNNNNAAADNVDVPPNGDNNNADVDIAVADAAAKIEAAANNKEGDYPENGDSNNAEETYHDFDENGIKVSVSRLGEIVPFGKNK
jgi:hypothetical protein